MYLHLTVVAVNCLIVAEQEFIIANNSIVDSTGYAVGTSAYMYPSTR